MTGTPHGDTLAGNGLANVIRGLAGDDHLFGWNGNDTLYGNAGIDSLYGLDGDDQLHGGGGLDRFYFTPDFGNDTIHDYVLGATRAEGEEIHLCMGGGRTLADLQHRRKAVPTPSSPSGSTAIGYRHHHAGGDQRR